MKIDKSRNVQEKARDFSDVKLWLVAALLGWRLFQLRSRANPTGTMAGRMQRRLGVVNASIVTWWYQGG